MIGGARIADCIILAVIAKFFPVDKARDALKQTGCASARQSDLPGHMVIHWVIPWALHKRSPNHEILHGLLEGVHRLLDPSAPVKITSESWISQARSHLGPEPLKLLPAFVMVPIGEKRTKEAWHRLWQLISLTSTAMEVADTAYEEPFGRPGASRRPNPLPRSPLWHCWKTEGTSSGMHEWPTLRATRSPWPTRSCPHSRNESCCAWWTGSPLLTGSGKPPGKSGRTHSSEFARICAWTSTSSWLTAPFAAAFTLPHGIAATSVTPWWSEN